MFQKNNNTDNVKNAQYNGAASSVVEAEIAAETVVETEEANIATKTQKKRKNHKNLRRRNR